ncbi:MAG TPA: A/G-specific adenine glycosylase [Myxococcaceae bacterium]|nr:A/G-specific adenine glycosylase [Myxococcaceae bacterium]
MNAPRQRRNRELDTDPARLEALRRALLAHYRAQKRDLPWRRTSDPYAIWVSEVMLQQTQGAVVERYFTPFLARFPTVTALAAAPLDDVLAAWRGLGYYARARNLHRAARAVVQRHHGELPRSAAELRALPGFGRYTTGAVASIAFGLAEPVVDGNVARVLSRLFAVEGLPGDPARERRLWTLAGQLLARDRPGDWNQALMELGATLCLAARPTCLLCPVRRGCTALARGLVDRLPPPRPPPARRRLRLAAAVVERRGELLLARRPPRGLFGGLWELPSREVAPTAGRAAVRRTLGRALGPGATVGEWLGDVERTLTHRALTISLFRATAPKVASPPRSAGLRWVRPEEASRLGMSTAMLAALQRATASAPRASRSGTPSRSASRAQAPGRAKLSVQPMPKRRGTMSAGSSGLT